GPRKGFSRGTNYSRQRCVGCSANLFAASSAEHRLSQIGWTPAGGWRIRRDCGKAVQLLPTRRLVNLCFHLKQPFAADGDHELNISCSTIMQIECSIDNRHS